MSPLKMLLTWKWSQLPTNTSTKTSHSFLTAPSLCLAVWRCLPHPTLRISLTLPPSPSPLLLFQHIHPTSTVPQWHRGPTDRAKTPSFLCSDTKPYENVYKKLPEVTSTVIRVHTKISKMSPVYQPSSLIFPCSLPFSRGVPWLDFSWAQPRLRNLNYDSINMYWISAMWPKQRTRETPSAPQGHGSKENRKHVCH